MTSDANRTPLAAAARRPAPRRRAVAPLPAAALVGAYMLCVALLAFSVDADQEGRGGAAAAPETALLLVLALVVLQVLLGHAIGWPALLLLFLPVVGGWWVERDHVPGFWDLVPMWFIAAWFAALVGGPLTAAGALARRWRWRVRDALDRRLAAGAAVTLLAALVLPRLRPVAGGGAGVDAGDAVLAAVLVVATIVLFGIVGASALQRDTGTNRPATVGLAATGAPLVAMFLPFGPLSRPTLTIWILCAGLALTLGLEGARRARVDGRRGRSVVALALGAAELTVAAVLLV
jgi:hypothetical protein